MEAIQAEFNKLKNDLENCKVKNNLLKTEYEKVKSQNKRLKKLVNQLNI